MLPVNDELNSVIEQLNHILNDHNIEPGAMPSEISGRIHQARDLLGKVEQALRERKMIR